MSRRRLSLVGLLSLSLLSGCGIFRGDRPTLCERIKACREKRHGGGEHYEAMPVSYPGMQGGGTIIMQPGEILPAPGDAPKIAPPKIKDKPGKEFELDQTKGTKGPMLPIPGGIKSD